MAWIKLDHNVPRHPKIAGLSNRAFRWWITGLCYASEFLTDGALPNVFIATVPRKAWEELIGADLWYVDEPGRLLIHDYLKHQTSKAMIERERRRNTDRRTASIPTVNQRSTGKNRDQKVEGRRQKVPPNPPLARGTRASGGNTGNKQGHSRSRLGYCEHDPQCLNQVMSDLIAQARAESKGVMRTSEQTTTLLAALVLARKDFKPFTRDAIGVVGKDHPYNPICRASWRHHPSLPHQWSRDSAKHRRRNLKPDDTRRARLGRIRQCVYPLPATTSAQAFGSALTYGRRYSLQALLCLAAADDDGATDAPPARKKPADKKPPGKTITNQQRKALWTTAERAGWNSVQFKKYLETTVGIHSSADVLETQYDDLLTVFGTPYEPEGEHA